MAQSGDFSVNWTQSQSRCGFKELGERQLYVDCDVIQADGGTRTAAITGGFTAMALALNFLKEQEKVSRIPLKYYISAISVGLSGDTSILDLNYDEDSNIGTDMNFVMNEEYALIEVQGTAEKGSFTQDQLGLMMALAQKGCEELFQAQAKVIHSFFPMKSSHIKEPS